MPGQVLLFEPSASTHLGDLVGSILNSTSLVVSLWPMTWRSEHLVPALIRNTSYSFRPFTTFQVPASRLNSSSTGRPFAEASWPFAPDPQPRPSAHTLTPSKHSIRMAKPP